MLCMTIIHYTPYIPQSSQSVIILHCVALQYNVFASCMIRIYLSVAIYVCLAVGYVL